MQPKMQTKAQTNQHTTAIYPAYRETPPPPLPYELAFDDDTEYPESDGQPMAETELNRDLMIDSILTLKARFQDVPNVCVSGDMLMYYVMKEPRKSVAPDVFVTFGVEKKQRRIYRIWEEGKPPDFVLEFSSKRTFANDLGAKKTLYAEVLGVREYFLFDAEGEYLPTPLMGFRLVGTEYVPIRPEPDGKLFAETLGLSLGLRGDGFGYYDPVAARWLETPMDEAAAKVEEVAALADRLTAEAAQAKENVAREALARQHAEGLVQEETAARQRAEAERRHAEAEAERKRVEAAQADARADQAEDELAELRAAYQQLQIELERQKSSDIE